MVVSHNWEKYSKLEWIILRPMKWRMVFPIKKFQVTSSFIVITFFFSPWTHSLKKTYFSEMRFINYYIIWQSTPVLLPGKSHGQRSLVGYSPWGHKESDMTEWLHDIILKVMLLLITNHYEDLQALFLKQITLKLAARREFILQTFALSSDSFDLV